MDLISLLILLSLLGAIIYFGFKIIYFGFKIDGYIYRRFNFHAYNYKSILLILGAILIPFILLIIGVFLEIDKHPEIFNYYIVLILVVFIGLLIYNFIYLVRKTNFFWAIIIYFYQILAIIFYTLFFIFILELKLNKDKKKR